MNTRNTPAQTWDAAGRQLAALRRLGQQEKKVHGAVSVRTQQKIVEALAAAEALIAVDDIRAAISVSPKK